MMKRVLYLLFIFVLAVFKPVVSQDKTDSTKIYYSIASNEDVLILDTTEYSKKLDGFHRYLPELRYGDFFQRQANPGHAVRQLDFSVEQFAKSLDRDILYSEPYYPYLWRKDNIRYYNSLKAITDLYYVMGQDKEQLFRVLHAQPVTSNLYFSVEHKVLNSPGAYQHHLSNHESPVFNLRYHTLDKKYHILTTYFHNKVEADDNGGIKELTYFTDSTDFDDRILIPVNLQESKLLIRGGGIHIRQAYFPSADSLKPMDSLGTSFYHDLYYQKDSYVYQDGGNINGFYPGMQDIGDVRDSTAIKQLLNEIGVKFRYKSVSLDLGLAHKYYELWQSRKDSFVNSFTPSAEIEFKRNGWYISAYGDISLVDNQQEWKLITNFRKDFKQFSLNLNGGILNSIPAMMHSSYRSTYFNWERAFDDVYLTYAQARFNHKYFNAGMAFYDVSNFIYFDPLGLPRQAMNSFQLAQFRLEPVIQWKGFTFKNTVVYQDVIGDDYLNLPEFLSRHELYYAFNLIEDVLRTQVGSQLSFNSGFYGHRYIPATQVFALQNQQKMKAHPYVDVFANFYIKRARIFVRYSHLNALAGSTGDYFMMPAYPMRDDSFQFGISWMFYD